MPVIMSILSVCLLIVKLLNRHNMPVYVITELIASADNRSLKVHEQLSNNACCLVSALNLHLSFFIFECASIEGPGESARMRSLVRDFAVRLCKEGKEPLTQIYKFTKLIRRGVRADCLVQVSTDESALDMRWTIRPEN